jgi:hypothetical protein
MQLPERYPEPGYYYHYKHDPNGAFNNYAYFIFGAGCNTEECPPEQQYWLNYRPLYDAFVYVNGKMMDNRPLQMFFDIVEHKGRMVPRFSKITDEGVIAQLSAERRTRYPSDFL